MKTIGIIVVVAVLGAGAYYFLMGGEKGGGVNVKTPEAGSQSQTGAPAESTVSSGAGSSAANPGTASVIVSNFSFGPNIVKIRAGGAVTWTHDDLAGHTVTGDDGSWGSKVLSKGKSFTQTFEKAGTYSYHCEPHPSMKGTVIVE